MSTSLLSSCVLSLLCSTLLVSANTEIINFGYPERFPDLPPTLTGLKPRDFVSLDSPARLSLPVRHGSNEPDHTLVEFSYELDGQSEWRRWLEEVQTRIGIKARRTIRLSWPASHPMSFDLNLFAIPSQVTRSTRSYGGYLVISSRPTSVHSPVRRLTSIEEDAEGGGGRSSFEAVPVRLVLEPVWIGAIPQSLIGPLVLVVALVRGLISLQVSEKVTRTIQRLGGSTRGENREKGE